ncbi:MAG: hypothetical protein U0599_16750 [Vicinamibacteria bacterium]
MLRTTRALIALSAALAAAPASAQVRPAAEKPLALNEKQYFSRRGLDVLVFTNEYNGMFFDEKTAGVEMIHHGVRTATGGAVRLSPTPEQWDQIPKVVERSADAKTGTIEVTLRYEAFAFDSKLVVTPDGQGFRRRLRRQAGAGRARGPRRLQPRVPPVPVLGAHVPRHGRPGVFPRYPNGPDRRCRPRRRSDSSRATRRSTCTATGATWRRS